MPALQIYRPDKVMPSIFESVASGLTLTETLSKPGMPSISWFRQNLQDNATMQRGYQMALEARAHALADQIIALADSQPPAHLEGAALAAWVQQLKLRCWARTWVCARLAPKQWGDRVGVDVNETRISITAVLAAANARVEGHLLARDSETDSDE